MFGHVNLVNPPQPSQKSMFPPPTTAEDLVLEAARNGNTAAIIPLLETISTTVNDIRGTPMIAAAMNGHVDVIKLLFDMGCDVNKGNASGMTPLVAAVRPEDKPEVCLCLLLAHRQT
mgnify:CR=1 FL=1